MKVKIAAIYTSALIVPRLSKLIKEEIPNCELFNILDDSLIYECIACQSLTKNVVNKLCKISQYAYDSGVDVIFITCSSVGDTCKLISKLLPIPIIRIDDAMIEQAVKYHDKLGVIATLKSTMEPTCNLIKEWAINLNKEVTIIKGLATGAFENASIGNIQSHDVKIENIAENLASQIDCIVLAQASMERMKERLELLTGKKVYASTELGVARLKEIVNKIKVES